MNKKHQVLTELFEMAQQNGHFIFHNDLVKKISAKYGFGNPFDATKLDSTSKFPQIMLDNDYFLLHLGEGYHQFVKGVSNGFHGFETIPSSYEIDWAYRKSILNEFDTSESNILSVVQNQGIIQQFLYGDRNIAANVYFPRRTKASFSYKTGATTIETRNLQMEIDLTMEYQGLVTIFEGKNDFPENFAVYQLYNPFLYYFYLKQENRLNIKELTCCYILRKRLDGDSVIRIYLYTFTEPLDMSSITLVNSAQYRLIQQ